MQCRPATEDCIKLSDVIFCFIMEDPMENGFKEQISEEMSENLKNGEVAKDRESSTESSAALSNPTENELINLDEIELSDEDTWLYTSPSKMSSEEKGLSPYKWLRKDVEDPNNRELQIAKTALVSKLDELEILTAQKVHKQTSKPTEETDSKAPCAKTDSVTCFKDETLPDKGFCDVVENEAVQMQSTVAPSEVTDIQIKSSVPDSQPYANVMDILERARLQEESLKQSSSRFFSEAAKTFPRGMRIAASAGPKLQKPASIEALHMYNGKQNGVLSSCLNAAQNTTNLPSPNQSPFGSTVSLSCVHDVHRSSLPNLNKGYYTLKTRKAKRASEPRVQCPLPIYPKSVMNGTTREVPHLKNIALPTPTGYYGESQTLPSSYRIKAKNISKPNQEYTATTMPRRESAPSQQYQRNLLQMHSSRRESMPCIAQEKDNCRKPQALQLSPKRSSAPFNHHLSSPLQNSRTVSLNCLPPESRISPIQEYSRRASHSPMKRQPLSSVHNYSSMQDECPNVQKNNDLRKSSLPSKIPSPSSRSGIPVPSTQIIARSGQTDDEWDRDFY